MSKSWKNFDSHTPPSAQIKLAWSRCSFVHIQLAYLFPKMHVSATNPLSKKNISSSTFVYINQRSFMPLLHSSGESWQLCVALLWWQEQLREPEWNFPTEWRVCLLRGRDAWKYHHTRTIFINLQKYIKQMTAFPATVTQEPLTCNF